MNPAFSPLDGLLRDEDRPESSSSRPTVMFASTLPPIARCAVVAVALFVAACGTAGTASPNTSAASPAWTAAAGDTFAGATLNDVATFGNGFIAVGSAPTVSGRQFGGIWTSADGGTWTVAAPTTPFEDATVQAAAAEGNGLIAVGMACFGECKGYQSWTASDASTWSERVKAPDSDNVVPTSIVTRGTLTTGIGDDLVDVANGRYNGRVFTTSDGKAWRSVPDIAAMNDARLSSIAVGTGAFVVVGSVTGPGGRAAAAWWSTDGIGWARATDDPSFATATLSRVVTGGSGYLAVGNIGSDGAVWTSTDGRTWTRISDGGAFTGHPLVAIATNGKGFVAIGGDGTGGMAWTSIDGMAWIPIPTITGSTGMKFVGVAVGVKSTVIVGKPGPTSADAGLVWFGPLP